MYKHRKLIIGIIAGLLALLMIVPTLVSVLSISAGAVKSTDFDDDIKALRDRISDMQSTINGLNDEAAAIQRQKDQLDDDIAANKESTNVLANQKRNLDMTAELMRMDMENTQKQIQEYNKLIALKQQEVDAAAREEERQNVLYRERVRAMEENGEVSYLSVLFKARSFSDLLDRLDMIEEIVESDQLMLQDLQAAREKVVEAQQDLELEKNSLMLKKDEYKVKEQDYLDKRAEADGLLVELDIEHNGLGDQYASVEADEKALNDDIFRWLSDQGDVSADLSDLEAQKAEIERQEAAAAEKVRKAALAAAAAASKSSSTSGTAQSYSAYSSGEPAESGFLYPLPAGVAQLTCPFGYRIHPITGRYSMHNAVDLACASGTNIYASKSGTVIISSYSYVYGNYVVISHGGGEATQYSHMSSIATYEGAYVTQGSTIGYVGTTGYSTGNHLDFEIIINGEFVNPMSYITLE